MKKRGGKKKAYRSSGMILVVFLILLGILLVGSSAMNMKTRHYNDVGDGFSGLNSLSLMPSILKHLVSALYIPDLPFDPDDPFDPYGDCPPLEIDPGFPLPPGELPPMLCPPNDTEPDPNPYGDEIPDYGQECNTIDDCDWDEACVEGECIPV